MKKIFILIIALFLTIVPNVMALAQNIKIQRVEVLYPSDTVIGSGGDSTLVEGNGTSNVRVTFKAINLKVVDGDVSLKRPGGSSWLGVKVVAPKGLTKAQLEKATYSTKDNMGSSPVSGKSFWSNQDTPDKDNFSSDKQYFINVYVGVNVDKLRTATIERKNVITTWEFDWDNDKSVDQTVSIIYSPASITLEDENSPAKIWNSSIYENVKASVVNPNTLDSVYIYFVILGVSIISLVGLVIVLKKSFKRYI